MNKRTVRSGLNLIIAGIVAIILSTFFNDDVTRLLSLTIPAQKTFIAVGLFSGGLCSGLGIMIAMAGALRSRAASGHISLVRTWLVLVAVILLFFVLFYRSLTSPQQSPLRPDETIVI